MAEYTNFYETVKEAKIRLQYTIVLYDGEPVNVLAIADHKKDGIFRIYMEPIGNGQSVLQQGLNVPHDFPEQECGPAMDKWMEQYPDKILRKQMNSPLFNKFRPFALGMCNYKGRVYYVERHPQRITQQGLTGNMLKVAQLSVQEIVQRPPTIPVDSVYIKDTILGNYPSADECLSNLQNPEIANDGVGFSREFCLLRGPIDTMFIGYRTDVVGILPNGDFSKVRISKKFGHCKEVVTELGIFQDILVK